jgi:hypothetical protein
MGATMRTLISLVFLGFNMVATAQSWCHPGSEWRYGFTTSVPDLQPEAVLRSLYVGDTLLQGELCERFSSTIFATDTNGLVQALDLFDRYTTTSPDLIRFWNGTEYSFDTLVYYGGGPGTTWHFEMFEPVTILVLDTGSRTINGLNLRYSVIDLGGEWVGLTDTIFERIGPIFLFASYPVMFYPSDGRNGPLQCYKDDGFDYITSYGSEQLCSIALAADALDYEVPASLKIFPNPASVSFRMEGLEPGPVIAVALYDALGKCMRSWPQADVSASFAVHGLLPGLYALQIAEEHKALSHLKLIIE